MMEYKGYTGKVEFDNDAGIFHGQVIDMSDVITFQGTSVDELRREFETSVDDYLEFCAERGESPERPFSGRFVVRTEPALHKQIALAATRANQSINAWIIAVLQHAVVAPTIQPDVALYAEVIRQARSTIVSQYTGLRLDSDMAEVLEEPQHQNLHIPSIRVLTISSYKVSSSNDNESVYTLDRF